MMGVKCSTQLSGHRKHHKWYTCCHHHGCHLLSSNTFGSPARESHEPGPPWGWKCAGRDARHPHSWGLMTHAQGTCPDITAGQEPQGWDQAPGRTNTVQSPRVGKSAPPLEPEIPAIGKGATERTGAFQRSP